MQVYNEQIEQLQAKVHSLMIPNLPIYAIYNSKRSYLARVDVQVLWNDLHVVQCENFINMGGRVFFEKLINYSISFLCGSSGETASS